MRLISQNEMADIPYDLSALFVNEEHSYNPIKDIHKIDYVICARLFSNADFVMGTYDDEKNVTDILERIRKAYRNGQDYFQFPKKEFKEDNPDVKQ